MNKVLWLKRIEEFSGLREYSVEQLAESIQHCQKDFFRQFENRNGPNLTLLSRIADFYEISVDDLISGPIDREWIRSPSLPESFRAAEGSRIRTSLAVTSWLTTTYGEQTSDSIVRAVKVPKATFTNPETTVRLRLLCSLLRAAKSRGVPESDIFNIGLGAVQISANRSIHESLTRQSHPRALYEFLFTEQLKKFESNFAYKISSCTSEAITVSVVPYEKCVFENGMPVVTDRSLSVYRWGVLAGCVRALGLPNAKVEPVQTSTFQNPEEKIRLRWNIPKPTLSMSAYRR